MRVLKLNDTGTKLALKSDTFQQSRWKLEDLPVLGRGKFSIVYDNGDSALHLTCDPSSYALHCDGVAAVKSKHFSKVLKDHGVVGHQGAGDLTLYAFETEKLVPLRGFNQARKLYKQIINLYDYFNGVGVYERRDLRAARYQKVLGCIIAEKSIGHSLKVALSELSHFLMQFNDVALDLHAANFMVRPECGTLVLNDPVVDYGVYVDACARLTNSAQKIAA